MENLNTSNLNDGKSLSLREKARIVDGEIEMNKEIDGVLWTVETYSACYMDMGVRVSRDGETVWSNPHYLSTDGFDPDEDEITFSEYLKGLVEHFFDEIIETVEEEMKMKAAGHSGRS